MLTRRTAFFAESCRDRDPRTPAQDVAAFWHARKQASRWLSSTALAGVLAVLGPVNAHANSVPARVSQSDSANSATASTQSVAPTSLDPCQLVTSDEASSLAGVTYAAGTEDTTPDGGKLCVYGPQTTNVFMVLVAQAPDAATAQAEWSQEQSEVQAVIQSGLPGGVSIDLSSADLPNLEGADRAAIAMGSRTLAGATLNGSACYLLKGNTFVAFSDVLLGTPAPGSGALQSEAQTVVDRLP
jgi:hypothetical protein